MYTRAAHGQMECTRSLLMSVRGLSATDYHDPKQQMSVLLHPTVYCTGIVQYSTVPENCEKQPRYAPKGSNLLIAASYHLTLFLFVFTNKMIPRGT